MSGSYPLAKMSRLAQYLAGQQGSVLVQAEFGVGEEKLPWLRGVIRGDLEMTCQRCMQPMQQHMDISFHLIMVHSDAAAEQLPDEMDPLVVAGDSISLLEVIEGELILSLPIVAMHDKKDCAASGVLSGGGDASGKMHKENPFSVLSKLKTKH